MRNENETKYTNFKAFCQFIVHNKLIIFLILNIIENSQARIRCYHGMCGSKRMFCKKYTKQSDLSPIMNLKLFNLTFHDV